ncbi:hypothetical protein SASPL_131882 [Salvia splendens]|uniref:Terpene synthase N-terminal domain-containing protein n=1 Tax=Salvia splendens TaxID=180675 RepID=A0A8X8ZKP7_SALSN|nr:hypothetical protein SASPL_131882 [Salvia splendens]
MLLLLLASSFVAPLNSVPITSKYNEDPETTALPVGMPTSFNRSRVIIRHMRRAGELIMQVKMMLKKETDPIRQLELIDELQRLGLSDHFQKEFKEILNSVYLDNKIHERKEENDLYSTALAFRLLREHGFHVAQEVLECFKNEKGEFKANLVDDTRGLLQLYEAL